MRQSILIALVAVFFTGVEARVNIRAVAVPRPCATMQERGERYRERITGVSEEIATVLAAFSKRT